MIVMSAVHMGLCRNSKSIRQFPSLSNYGCIWKRRGYL